MAASYYTPSITGISGRWAGIVISLGATLLYSQQETPEESSQEIVYERILEAYESEEIGQTDFLQVLKDLENDPIDINAATIRELLRIPFLDQEMARQIVRFRNQNGRYQNQRDLLAIPGMTEELLLAIWPLVRLRSAPASSPLVDYRVQLGRSLHTVRGYEGPRGANFYQNPFYLYHRLRWRPSPVFQAGLIGEKDSGESNWFDYMAFHVMYHWIKGKSHILVGDFNLESGQRLVFSSPYGSPVALGNIPPFGASSLRWIPHLAADENAFLRGVMWHWAFVGRLSLNLLYSNHAIDATLAADSLTVRSFYTSGYHRTRTEIDKRNLVRERLLGGGVTADLGSGQVGLQAAQNRFSLPVRSATGSLRNEFTYLSGFYFIGKESLRLGGEAALLDGKFPAIQQALLIHIPRSGLRYGALAYYYHPEYWALHGRGFGGISEPPANELGYFITLSVRISPTTQLAGYFHTSRPARPIDEFPFLKRSQQFQVRQKINRSWVSVRFTARVRRAPATTPSRQFSNLEQVTRTARFQVETNFSQNLRISHRVELAWLSPSRNSEKNYGVSFYQDLRFRLSRNLLLQARWSQFDIPTYDYRIYEYETDLPGNFRNVLLNERGLKWFLLLRYHLSSRWRFALKYKETYYPDKETLGSGLDMVLGNRRKEIRGQLQVLF